MGIRFSPTLRQARAVAVKIAIDKLGTSGATAALKLYAGDMPSTAGGTPGGSLIATIPFTSANSSAVAGAITFTSVLDVTATGSGTITFVRVVDGTGAFVMDISAGAGQPITLANNHYLVEVGSVIKMNSFTITEGNG